MIALARPFDPHDASDLRRKNRRDVAEGVTARAVWLKRRERTLVLAVYRDEMSATDVARVMGVHPRVIRRRVRQAVQRLFSAEAEFVVRERDAWGPTRREIATRVLVQGQSMRRAARDLGLKLHIVRRHVAAVRSLMEGSRR